MDTMDSSMEASKGAPPTEARQAATELARWWWAWLVVGILWIIASIVILQFRQASITLVGVIVGIMFLAAGIQEFAMAALTTSGWRWLWAIFGVIFVIGGIYALINPVQTFLAVADLLGFLFALVGIFWIIEAFATMDVNSLWWLGLISGFLMVLLGFWAGGQFLTTQAYTLLIFAGIWALFHGIGDIIKAFSIRQLRRMPAI
ncbi:MAG: HdeD family acid-resistance protein [Ktedonobacterales bacterium]